MTKRYRERLERVEVGAPAAPVAGLSGAAGDTPVAFRWRGHQYRVLQVLGHWREDPGWWRRPDGHPVRIEQTDLWRVEATSSRLAHPLDGVRESQGVYELVHRDGAWTLDRIWD